MKIAFEEHGSGKPIVLLHAFPLSRRMWTPQIDALTANNFRVILPDLRGFGESHNFSDINSIKDMAEDIVELLVNLKIERALFCGLSMGGYVLFEILSRVPEKFAAIILADTTQSADTNEKRDTRFDLIEKIEKNGAQTLIEDMLPTYLSGFTKQNKPELIKTLEKMFGETNPQGAIAALRGMAERADFSDALQNISLPALLIFGEDDKIADAAVAENLQKLIFKSQLFTIKNAGHYSNLEQPEEFNRILLDFAKTVAI